MCRVLGEESEGHHLSPRSSSPREGGWDGKDARGGEGKYRSAVLCRERVAFEPDAGSEGDAEELDRDHGGWRGAGKRGALWSSVRQDWGTGSGATRWGRSALVSSLHTMPGTIYTERGAAESKHFSDRHLEITACWAEAAARIFFSREPWDALRATLV